MGLNSGSTTTYTPVPSTSTTEPWGAIQEPLKETYQQAQELYNQGVGFTPYSGPTYAGLTGTQQTAMQGLLDKLQAGQTAGQTAESYVGGMLSQPTTELYTNQYVTGGAGAIPGSEYLSQAMGSAMGSPSGALLEKTVSGGYLPGSNPYLDEVYDSIVRQTKESFTEDILPTIRQGATQAGMYDSSRRALAEGSALGDVGAQLASTAANLYGGAYESERDRQMQAAQLGLGSEEAMLSRLLSGAGLETSLSEAQKGRELEAGSLLSQLYDAAKGRELSAASLAPQLTGFGEQYAMNLGGIEQALNQQELDARQQFYEQQQMAPWQRLAAMSDILGGVPSGQQTASTSYQPTGSTNTGLGVLGGASTGAGLGALLGLSNPWIAALAAGGGALGAI